jgi:diaminohydroxyphosphoribosylaminopyrimidine deaminase/5-amino-6-(5-phosphoribosylamino)uracil reductase
LELAFRGQGGVEPNPLVGCVIVAGEQLVGEGWHAQFGGPHAEVHALQTAGAAACGATLYVTLEPCCHFGKTPPCTDAILRAGIRRVVVADRDPFPAVAGGGLEQLQQAGVQVEVGLLADEARRLNAPYLKLVTSARPWVIAKWAMTVDGKIATAGGDSRWVSGDESRRRVHQLRGRVDAIMVGKGTATVDDPQLTARPPGKRAAIRIVLDSTASLASDCHLVRTAREVPVLIAAGPQATRQNRQRLEQAGCEVWVGSGRDRQRRLDEFLAELGRRRLTNVLVEGGSRVLGSLFDLSSIDEVHVFLAAKLFGGMAAPGPLAGRGVDSIAQAVTLEQVALESIGTDVYLQGRVARPSPPGP